MNLKSIPRFAVDRYLRTVRWPLDRTARLLPGRNGSPSRLENQIDRVDATVRGVAAVVLNDAELQTDAVRRRAAADERDEALALRDEAERVSRQADERMSERDQQAEERRRRAEQQAERRRRQAEEQKKSEKQRVRGVAQRRKQAERKVAKAKEEAREDRARFQRLEQLETEQEALAEQEEALTARDEAQRLEKAAAKAKAARKRS